MTTRNNGRPAATTPARRARAWLRLSLALTLCVPALTVFAAPADDGAPFPARHKTSEEPAKAGSSVPAKPATPSFSDRALGLAASVNGFLAPAMSLDLPGLDALDLPAEAVGTPVAGDSKVKSVLQKALALLGTPYRWGGTDPDKGFDCSGLVGYVFRNALGIELPRVSRDMAKNGELITDRAKLAAGDLVFFGRKGRVNHVGIYVGDGRFVHAPSRGKDVTVSSLDQGYWSGRFMQARRVPVDGG